MIELHPLKTTCVTARKVKEVMLASLGSYMHLEMCQSLMLTAKATLVQRSAPEGIG